MDERVPITFHAPESEKRAFQQACFNARADMSKVLRELIRLYSTGGVAVELDREEATA
jgi:hypothetical protein